MNIEETTENLKKYISFSEKECNFPSIWDWNWHMDLANDIKTLLTAYEKEKELLELASNMLDNIDYDQIPIAIGELKSELEKEKENNKELRKYYATRKEVEELKEINEILHDSAENYINKDKVIAKVIEVKERPVKDEFITATQGKLNTIIDIESLLDKEE